MRDRNEHIEGLTEAHQMELSLDGNRVQVFTINPKRANTRGIDFADADVDSNLKVRMAVKAGPHDIGASFIMRDSALSETTEQPYQAHFNYYRHPRLQPAVDPPAVPAPLEAASV